MLGRFNEIFGISDDVATEQGRFVQRINQTAFRLIEQSHLHKEVFEQVCYLLGINAQDRIAKANSYGYGSLVIPGIRTLTSDNFTQTLKVLVLLHYSLDGGYPKSILREKVAVFIVAALDHATIDLGVSRHEGMFYPTGAKELDEPLIDEPLQWLHDFPAEKADYLKALRDYTSKSYGDVVGDCYNVVEGLARNMLHNKKVLDNNREDLLRTVGLSQEWKGLLNNFIAYANEYKRHASDKRHNLNPIEVEGFLYMTGLLARMIIEANKKPSSL